MRQRKKKAAWDVVHSPLSAAYTVFASRMRHHATTAGGKLPHQPVDTASCRVTKRQNVSSSFVNATSCRVAKRQVQSSTGAMLSRKKGGDLRTTTKAVDCRSHRSPPPKLLIVWQDLFNGTPGRLCPAKCRLGTLRLTQHVTCTRQKPNASCAKYKGPTLENSALTSRRDAAAKLGSQSTAVNRNKSHIVPSGEKLSSNLWRTFSDSCPRQCKHSRFFIDLLDTNNDSCSPDAQRINELPKTQQHLQVNEKRYLSVGVPERI